MFNAIGNQGGLAQMAFSLGRLFSKDVPTALFVAAKLSRTSGFEAFLGTRV